MNKINGSTIVDCVIIAMAVWAAVTTGSTGWLWLIVLCLFTGDYRG